MNSRTPPRAEPRERGRFGGRRPEPARIAFWAAVLAALIPLGVRAQSAGPQFNLKVTASTNYYDVKGSTREELIASRAQGRPRKDDRHFDGLTTWKVEWSYRYSSRNKQHFLDSVDVKTVIEVTLPRWTPPPGADADLVERWNKYVRALGIHELGHVSYARLATAEMKKRLSVLPSYATAQELRDAVERTGQQVLADFRARDAEYDRDTAHGMKQGARFAW